MEGKIELDNIPKLYRYICHFDEISYLNDTKLEQRIPGVKSAVREVINVSTFYPNKKYEERRITDLEIQNNECEFSVSSGESRMHAVLRHLRNAIAHGNIKNFSNQYELHDFWTTKQNSKVPIMKESAHGRLPKRLVIKIITLFNDVLDN